MQNLQENILIEKTLSPAQFAAGISLLLSAFYSLSLLLLCENILLLGLL